MLQVATGSRDATLLVRMGWPGDRGEGQPPRGRSGLHRAGWWPTATRGDSRESATENRPPPPPGGGQGETVVQETTSTAGDRRGSANPTWSKTRQRAFEGGPPELAGRSHEGVGNGTPRWMVANRAVVRRHGEQNPAYEPAHPHSKLRPAHVRVGRVAGPQQPAARDAKHRAARSWGNVPGGTALLPPHVRTGALGTRRLDRPLPERGSIGGFTLRGSARSSNAPLVLWNPSRTPSNLTGGAQAHEAHVRRLARLPR
jgi:hypothetical protein